MTQKQRSWLRRLFKRKHGILPRHRRNRVMLSEQLEPRQMLAGDTFDTAEPVSALYGLQRSVFEDHVQHGRHPEHLKWIDKTDQEQKKDNGDSCFRKEFWHVFHRIIFL